jgi:hypothetical protein
MKNATIILASAFILTGYLKGVSSNLLCMSAINTLL